MSISKTEETYEKEHLANTIDIINEIIGKKNISINEYKDSIVERKKYLWQNKQEFNEVELYSTMDNEDLNVKVLNENILKVYRLHSALETPYFSRIDFKSNDETRKFYIGLTNISIGEEIFVHDWRANIGNLYYNYGLGPSEYESADGIIKGETLKKRQFNIVGRKLIDAYDDEIGLPDELLGEVLKNNTDEHMKNIVSTIQKEQNDIIRYPGRSTLIVEGVAGSGKTSVALHRIAYLLYNHKSLNNKNILIFSPNETFTEYISNVLPELGEENVQATTFEDFTSNYIKNVKLERQEDFLERIYEHGQSDNIREKFSLNYKIKIEKFLSDYFDSLKFTKKIGLGKTILSSFELNKMKDEVPKKLSFSGKIEYLGDKICNLLNVDEIKNSVRIKKMLFNILEIESDPLKLYERFSGVTFDEELPYEDILPVLFINFEINGYPEKGDIKIVVIDEAQDYSLWQMMFIKNIFKSATFTILGDPNQSLNPFITYKSLEKIGCIFTDYKYKTLEKSYRSSAEIVEYANRYIENHTQVIRGPSGFPVKDRISTDREVIAAGIQELRDAGMKRIAIITKNNREAESVKKINSDVKILPVYKAKGLEFDGVIVYTESDEAYTEDEKNLLYVAITRALHGAIIYNQKI